MGLFNDITNGPGCSECGSPVEWQSKFARVDGEEVDLYLARIDIKTVSIGEMHGGCRECGCVYDAEIVDGEPRNVTVDSSEETRLSSFRFYNKPFPEASPSA